MRRLIRKMLSVVSRGQPEKPSSPPTGTQSPAVPARDTSPAYASVAIADAVAELCLPTGDSQLDKTHSMLIDCVQYGYVKAVRDAEGRLRFGLTQVGRDRILRFYGAI